MVQNSTNAVELLVINDLLGYISRSPRVLDPEDDRTALRSDLSHHVTVGLYPILPTRHTATRIVKDEHKFEVSIQINNYNIAIYKFVTMFNENTLKRYCFIVFNILQISKYYFSHSL